MAGPFTETYTVGLPTATQAEVDGLIADLRSTVQKIGAAADKVTAAVPLIQASIQEIADAAKAFKIKVL